MAVVLSFAILSTIGILSYYYLLLDFEKVFYKGHVWRLFTCYMFGGGLSFKFLFLLFYIHFALSHCEEFFSERIHDFYYLVFMNAIFHYIVGWFMDMHTFMLPQFIMTFLYVYCKKEPDNKVNIWGFIFRSANLPWVHLVL